MRVIVLVAAAAGLAPVWLDRARAADYQVNETDQQINVVTPQLEAAVRKKGYVSGVAAQSLLDRKTGFRDPGFGLDIADFLLEPPSAQPQPESTDPHLRYDYNNQYHGRRAKQFVEGPQICTQAKELQPEVVRGKDFVAVRQTYKYHKAAPGKKSGSVWTQVLVFPVGKRYFISMDRVDSANAGDCIYLRIDMPGHLKHNRGDAFSQIYLSYHGTIAASEFFDDFPPDEKFHYLRDDAKVPERMIRAIRLRDPKTGKDGPWLAGMTLDPASVYEAWCHQRGYVCFIQEIGGRPVKEGESFSAAFIVGYFDSVDEMHEVYDRHKGHTALELSAEGWNLTK